MSSLLLDSKTLVYQGKWEKKENEITQVIMFYFFNTFFFSPVILPLPSMLSTINEILGVLINKLICKSFGGGLYTSYKFSMEGFPGGAMVKSLPANAGDMGSSPGPGRSDMPRRN